MTTHNKGKKVNWYDDKREKQNCNPYGSFRVKTGVKGAYLSEETLIYFV